jgi:hypothetical protein
MYEFALGNFIVNFPNENLNDADWISAIKLKAQIQDHPLG